MRAERRREPRFHVLHAGALSDVGQGEVVDLSRRGMALELQVEGGQRPAPGDCHLFQLSCSGSTVEVTGRVRWVAPGGRGPEGRPFERMKVGLDITEIVTSDRKGIWAALATAV